MAEKAKSMMSCVCARPSCSPRATPRKPGQLASPSALLTHSFTRNVFNAAELDPSNKD